MRTPPMLWQITPYVLFLLKYFFLPKIVINFHIIRKFNVLLLVRLKYLFIWLFAQPKKWSKQILMFWVIAQVSCEKFQGFRQVMLVWPNWLQL